MIYPWNEESENIFRKISSFGRARTVNMKLSRDFSRRTEINDLCDRDFFSISNNRRKHESWFNVPEDVFVRSINTRKGIAFEFKRIKF